MAKFPAMQVHPISPPRGRVPKRPRTHNELTELAQRLGADWRHGDNVMTWIRRHEASGEELSRLVRDGWSWADLGRALALVGIKYQTGPAIAGDVLRRKAGKARADERKRQANEALRRLPAAATVQPPVPSGPPRLATSHLPAAAVSAAVSPSSGITPPSEDDDPVFMPATLIRYGASEPSQTSPLPGNEPAPAPLIDVDAVLARFTGRK